MLRFFDTPCIYIFRLPQKATTACFLQSQPIKIVKWPFRQAKYYYCIWLYLYGIEHSEFRKPKHFVYIFVVQLINRGSLGLGEGFRNYFNRLRRQENENLELRGRATSI